MATDGELLEACRAGRTAAFAQLVDRYQGLVTAVTFASTGDRSLSEDLAQDTFVAAWRQLHDLREPSRFRAWLCGIARNLAAKARRRFGREVAVDELRAIDAAPALDDALADEQAEAIVWRSLESLPLTYREPLILYYREGRSAQQVADALELSVAAVEQRLSRGRKQLEAGVESLVERSLERSRPQRRLAVAVMGAIESGAAVAPAKAGTLMKPLLIGSAMTMAIAAGYTTCSRRDEAPEEERAAANEARDESEAGPTAGGVAREVIERVEARDREAAALAEPNEAPLQPFELTRLSSTSVGVNLLGGQSELTSPAFGMTEAGDMTRTISGRVMDDRGVPVRGAVVIGGKHLTLFLGDTVTAEAGAVSDADGRWSLTVHHADAASVVAFDRRGVSEVAGVPAGTDAHVVDLRLAAPASFTGTVAHGGEPVAAEIRLSGSAPQRRFVANADESGRFRLDYVPPGAYAAVATLSYRHDDSIAASVTADVVITAGKATVQDFVLPVGALVVTDVAWPKEHDTSTVSYSLVPGDHNPATKDELEALRVADPTSRFLLVGGDNLYDAMSFSDVQPGLFTACAVAARGRDAVVGLHCTQVEVTEATDTITVELDPFAD
jgi:RNA polymerase sigma factor (sigma-70 family)